MGNNRRRDPRTYFMVTNGYFLDPKIIDAGGDAALVDLAGIAYCSESMTDGLIPKGIVGRLTDREDAVALARRLLDVNRWHEDGHGCVECPQPGPHRYVIHDYLKHQRSRDEIEATRLSRQSAGQKGGRAKAANERVAGDVASATANAKASATPVAKPGLKQTASKSLAVSVSESEIKNKIKTSTSEAASLASDDDTARPEIDRLCELLADRIEANGSKRPNPRAKTWRDSCRRLLDVDKRTEDEITRAIDWCQTDTFWRTVVLSMPKLRDKYDQMRLVAQNQRDRAGVVALRDNGAPTSTTDHRVAQHLEGAARMRLLDQQLAQGATA